ncbi:MAG: hypothetical protein ACRD8W_08030, partial [Nitrososphaeraceae archaeon]
MLLIKLKEAGAHIISTTIDEVHSMKMRRVVVYAPPAPLYRIVQIPSPHRFLVSVLFFPGDCGSC